MAAKGEKLGKCGIRREKAASKISSTNKPVLKLIFSGVLMLISLEVDLIVLFICIDGELYHGAIV